MPKRVDPDEKRLLITEAATRVVVRDGVTGTTMRAVAAEAGVSVGQVQRYFNGKDELLHTAASTEAARTVARVAESVARLGSNATERQRMRTELLQLLPLDTSRHAGALFRRALAASPGAAGDGLPLDVNGTADNLVRNRLVAARDAGELRPGVDVDLENEHLVFIVAGLSDYVLAGRVTASQASVAIDYMLRRIFQAPNPDTHDRPRTPSDASQAPSDSALRLLRVAERHFAEKGIEGASLREIARDAGHSNRAAVQYHFGDRRGLVLAVLARRRKVDEQRRHAILDAYGQTGEPNLRGLAEALVLPMAANLDDPDGGRAYLKISAEYYLQTPMPVIAHHRLPDTSLPRWHQLIDQLADDELRVDPSTLVAPRMLAIRIALVELAVLASFDPRPDEHRSVAFIVDVVTRVLDTWGRLDQTAAAGLTLAE